jgi:hypothetical protein
MKIKPLTFSMLLLMGGLFLAPVFAEPPGKTKPKKPKEAKPIIKVAEAVNPDPFSDTRPSAEHAPAFVEPLNPLLRVELFSMPTAVAAKAQVTHPKEAELYQWLDEQIDQTNGNVKLEHFSLLRTKSGQRAKGEEIVQFPYPTEEDPPQIPQNITGLSPLGPNKEPANFAYSPATGTGYEEKI